MKASLIRNISSDQGTLGVFFADDFRCLILELPWRDNQNNISCIPAGKYECQFITSNHYGPCYWIKSVPGRYGILFHAGNVAGAEDKGYKTHSAGCLLLGSYSGQLWGQRAVLASRKARGRFLEYFNKKPFTLEIKEMFKK